MQKKSQHNDFVTLVTPADVVIGQMDKLAAHRNPAQLHRAISVFLFRRNTQNNLVELLLQQRSDKKIVGALEWANTACGNVWPGENYLDCARRRLQVELGIFESKGAESLLLQPVDKFLYQISCNELYGEHELDQVFVGKYRGEVKPNKEEVASITWMPWSDLQTIMGNLQKNERYKPTTLDYAPWFLLMLKKRDLMNKITKFVEENI